jgi:Ca-activated chloride channel family protein
MIKYFKIFIFLCLGFFSSIIRGQENDGKIRILFIFDGSNSMNAQWEKSSKIAIAKKLMTQTMDSLRGLENVELALRIYGHQSKILPGKQDCSDTKLEVPFASASDNYQKIINEIRRLEPKGTTPIARSLEYSAEDFPPCGDCRNIIILITDGIEACDEDPCAVAIALKEKNIKLKPFVIGLGLDTSYLSQFECVGEFLSAENEDAFKSVLKFVISQALNNTTAQINLNNINNLPKETNLSMSLYNSYNGKLMHTYMHTLNRFQNPDTLSLDPLYTYKVVVHSVPEVVLDSIKLIPGKHTVINIKSPLGKLNLKISGNDNPYNGINCIVKSNNQNSILNVQKMNTNKQYLVGSYDLEVLSIPRIKFKDVKINQSKMTDIVIPLYGSIQVNKSDGPAALFLKDKGKNIWVYDFNEERSIENLNIQPGNYFICFISNRSNSIAHTILKDFKITSAQNINFKL